MMMTQVEVDLTCQCERSVHRLTGRLMAPGLVVVKLDGQFGHKREAREHLVVVHLSSGLSVAGASNWEAAGAAALMLAASGVDWTESGETLRFKLGSNNCRAVDD